MGAAVNPWAVVSQQPAAAAASPHAPNAAGAWDVASEEPTPSSSAAAGAGAVSRPPDAAAPDNGGLGGWVQRNLEGYRGGRAPAPGSADDWGPLGKMPAGAIKSAGQVVGTLLDMIGHQTGVPDWAQYHGPGREAVLQHVQDAANWLREGSQPQGLWEHLGAIGEQVMEYMGTDGLLKLVGGPVTAVAEGGRAARTAEDLKNAQQVSATLAKNPKLAGLLAVGAKATRDALDMGAQTYLHTEDPGQAAAAAATGGALGAAAGGVEAGANALRRLAPRTVKIAGEEVPALAQQFDREGRMTDAGAAGFPKTQAAQQAAGAKVTANLAQRAGQTALDGLNATRQQFGAPAGVPQLAAPEGSEPFQFTLDTTPAREGTTGQIAHPAGKAQQPAAFPPKYTTASGPEPVRARTGEALSEQEARAAKGSAGTSGADISTAGAPGAKTDVARGGGVLQTTDAAQAESWRGQLEDLMNSPEYKKLSPAEQARVQAAHDGLRDQLRLYYNSPYAQRFAPAQAYLPAIRSYGNARDMLRASVDPVYEQIRKADPAFDSWQAQEANASSTLQTRGLTSDAYKAAQERLDEAHAQIGNIIDSSKGRISMGDYAAAKYVWRQSYVLNGLHNVEQRMANGITAEETDTGLQRVVTGNNRAFEAWLGKGNNRADVEKLIGADGIDNFKRMNMLLAKANTARSVSMVMRNVWDALTQDRATQAGTILGAAIAHLAGGSMWEGAVIGAAGARAVLHFAMAEPYIGNMIEYAAEHGLSPAHYAPLIARAISESVIQQQPEASEPASQPTGAPAAHPGAQALQDVLRQYRGLAKHFNPGNTQVIFADPQRAAYGLKYNGDLEFWPASSKGYPANPKSGLKWFPAPKPGTNTLEIYSDQLKNDPAALKEAIYGDLLHGMSADPYWGALRSQFMQNFTPQELQRQNRHDTWFDDVNNKVGDPLPPGKFGPTYDAYIRGWLAHDADAREGQVESGNTMYSPEQLKILRAMENYLKTGERPDGRARKVFTPSYQREAEQ